MPRKSNNEILIEEMEREIKFWREIAIDKGAHPQAYWYFCMRQTLMGKNND